MPVELKLNGDANTTVWLGDTYEEAGAVATLGSGADASSAIVTSFGKYVE